MKRLPLLVLISLFMLSACVPASPPTSTEPVAAAETLQPTVIEGTVRSTETQVPFTPQPTPTTIPTPVPTQIPARFDQAGYREFAVTRTYFPGLFDYFGDRSYSPFATTLSPSGDQFAMVGCFGDLTNLLNCETSNSGFLIIVDSESGELVNEIPLGGAWAGSVDFTSDGNSLLFATNEYKIGLWNLKTNEPGLTLLKKQSPKPNAYGDVAAAPDGRSLAAVVDAMLYVWKPTGEILFQAPVFQFAISAGLEYSSDGSRLTVFSPGRSGVDVYNTNDWTLVQRISHDQIRRVAISPDGLFVAATNSKDDTVTVWEVNSGERVANLDTGNSAYSVQFNPGGDLLLIFGLGNLEERDSYSYLGTLYETQTWTQVDTLYSFTNNEQIEFNQVGSRLAVFGSLNPMLWGLPDEKLKEGFEVVKQFQSALSSGDYTTAASLFEISESDAEYLTGKGFDLTNLPASFERLCADQVIFCHTVDELVNMGNDWDTLVYLVRLKDPDGKEFTAPDGATIQYLYLYLNAEGKPRIAYPAME